MPNFGLLQPLTSTGQSGVVAQLPSQPNAVDSFAGGLLQGAQTGQSIMASRAAVEAQKQQLAMQQAQQPGILRGQELANQKAQVGLLADQQAAEAAQQQQEQLKGVADAKDYIGAVVDVYKKQGQPKLAMTMLEGAQSLAQATIKTQKDLMEMTEQEAQNKFKRLQNAGTIAFTLTGLPDEEAADQYNKKYGKLLAGIDPQAPKLGSDVGTINAYLHGAVGTLVDWNRRMQDNPELAKHALPKEAQKGFVGKPAEAAPQPAIAKLQSVAEQKQQELQQAIAQFGAESPQAQALQQQVSQIEDAINKETGQGGLVASGIRGIKNAAKNLTKSNSPKAPQYSQADLEHTAKIHNMTVEQVKAKLGAK